MLLAVAGLAGFIAVAFGAYADHGLRETLDPEVYRGLTTALRYNQIHAVAGLAIGLALFAPTTLPRRGLALCGWAMMLGMALFCGSIYVSAALGWRGATILAPFGGSLMMFAWLGLAWISLSARLGGAKHRDAGEASSAAGRG